MRNTKLMALALLLSAGVSLFMSCSDDDKTSSKVLLRPVTTLKADLNHISLSWNAVEGATEYIVDIYRVTDGANDLYKTITTSETSITIDLDWDDSYQIKVKCNGNGRESAYWETDAITLVYPTILGQTKTIDTQARITWTPTDEFTITAITATALNEDGSESEEVKTYEVAAEEYAAGEKIITELSPNTSYKICAYSGEVNIDNYQGRVILTTGQADDYSGYAHIIDLTEAAYDAEYFNNLDWSTVEEGTLFLLPEGKTYNVNNSATVAELATSVHFATPQTLGEYATFLFDNAFRTAAGAQINKISFSRMNLKAKKTLNEVTDTGLSGKQIFCPESDNFNVNSILFNDCYIENFRSVVRSKYANGNIETITFEGCTINAIGNQGIISTDGKKTNHINHLVMNNCTVTNICGIADLRDSGSGQDINITNTTFCYAPMESSFLFRLDGGVLLTMENCVFGASMKQDGNKPLFNQIGSGGRGDYTRKINGTYINTYATSDLTLSDPLGWSGAGMNTNTLFQDPANNNFKLNSSFTGCMTTGAIQWRVM